eukprot:CAMPEP_0184696396 /NCGR_PEP_ID=MMETSP0313-20130426/3713_1 /TAXON_ID=2792 /ORGANISM="Porphyridium aerugineum, Strain SAG 1380-2" /LENGTH=429 /DNA_ID=CAMNT_0027155021 /DNA_START=35 /DNA_END=1324 /DNA_ORIENTATION=-
MGSNDDHTGAVYIVIKAAVALTSAAAMVSAFAWIGGVVMSQSNGKKSDKCVCGHDAASKATSSTPANERSVWIQPKSGHLSSLQLCSHDVLPALTQGQVRVKVHAIGLNFADIFAVLGLYAAASKTNLIPGLEFSGVVEQVCKEDESQGKVAFPVGSKVFGVTRFGGYATEINVQAQFLFKLPDDWNFVQGAAFPVQALTAYHALVELGAVKAKKHVLIQSGAGGVGINAIRLCQKLQAQPYVTVSSESKAKFLAQEMGIPEKQIIVRDPTAKGFAKQLRDALQANGIPGFDIVLESVGGHVFKSSYDCMNRNGRLVTFGAAHYMSHGDQANWFSIIWKYLTRPKIDPGELTGENKSIMGFNLIWLTDLIDVLTPEMEHTLDLLKDSPPVVGSIYSFQKLKDGLTLLQSGKSYGKVVIITDDHEVKLRQ